MLPVPTKLFLTAGEAEGSTPINAFDNALLSAKIGNLNLLKVSSICPPNIELVDKMPHITPGSLVPVAYGSLTSQQEGQIISAAIGVGFNKKDHYGVIMEFEGFCSANEAEEKVISMVKEGFDKRNLLLNDLKVITIEHKVEKVGAVIAAAVLLY
jgi:arginine decarboxylase